MISAACTVDKLLKSVSTSVFQDDRFPVKNVLRGQKWLSDATSKTLEAVFQLEKPVAIAKVAIGIFIHYKRVLSKYELNSVFDFKAPPTCQGYVPRDYSVVISLMFVVTSSIASVAFF